MLTSIFDDFKNAFRSGNMISRIILVNVVVYILINLINVFDANTGFAQTLIKKLSLLSNPAEEIWQIWSVITHMFLHVGFWHILWNMLLLYWFGRIIGDFLGDHRVLPLYILGGLCGGLFFIIWDQLLPGGTGMSWAYGASAAVFAVIMATAVLSPDYIFHLILIGPVKIKYIALGMLFLDLIGTAGNVNTGGHFGHIGGAFFGVAYVYFLRQGTDLTSGLQKLFAGFDGSFSSGGRRRKRNTQFKVYRNKQENARQEKPNRPVSEQAELDRILDKINSQGYEKLSEEERDFLYRVSKKK